MLQCEGFSSKVRYDFEIPNGGFVRSVGSAPWPSRLSTLNKEPEMVLATLPGKNVYIRD